MRPYQCPICLGCGNVPGGFYQSTVGHISGWTSANATEKCRTCTAGIIWGPDEFVKVETSNSGGQNFVLTQEHKIDHLAEFDKNYAKLVTLIQEENRKRDNLLHKIYKFLKGGEKHV